MKKILLLLVGVGVMGLLVFGLWFFMNRKSSDTFRQVLSVADSMEIAFIDPAGKVITKKMITHQPEVWLLTGTITNTNATPSKDCVFQATVQLFSQGKPLFVQPAALNFEPTCQHIAFLYEEKIYKKKFLVEGVEYLQGLKDELLPEENSLK